MSSKNKKEIKKAGSFLYSDEFMMFMLIIFPPLGLLMMWRKRRYTVAVMLLISILLGCSYIIVLRAVLYLYKWF